MLVKRIIPLLSIKRKAKLAIAGNGDNLSYKSDDINAFKDRADNLQKKAGFTASQVRNGVQIVDKLKQATTDEESVGAVVIFAHASQDGIYLDKEAGLYPEEKYYGNQNSASVAEIGRSVDAGEIKFDKNAVIVMGGCNCGKDKGTVSLAESMAKELGVTVYAATSTVIPEEVNGKETGKLQTKDKGATFNMYKMTGAITIEIPGYGSFTIPASVGVTNVGRTIDPDKLTQKPKN